MRQGLGELHKKRVYRDLISLFAEADLYKEQSDLVAINARLAKVWPTVLEKKDVLPPLGHGTHLPSKREFLLEE